jgi:hypothetical protein
MNGQLMNAKQLLEALFTPESRPSLRWLREMTRARAIRHVRIGRLIFYNLDSVREDLDRNRTLARRGC